jgi:hypothetical protein
VDGHLFLEEGLQLGQLLVRQALNLLQLNNGRVTWVGARESGQEKLIKLEIICLPRTVTLPDDEPHRGINFFRQTWRGRKPDHELRWLRGPCRWNELEVIL